MKMLLFLKILHGIFKEASGTKNSQGPFGVLSGDPREVTFLRQSNGKLICILTKV